MKVSARTRKTFYTTRNGQPNDNSGRAYRVHYARWQQAAAKGGLESLVELAFCYDENLRNVYLTTS